MKKSYLLLCAFILLLITGCATSSEVRDVERQTAAINAAVRDIKGNIDEINFSLQAESKRSRELQASVASIESKLDTNTKGLGEDLEVIKRNQADLGSKMFSGGGGTGGKITDGQLDEIRHEMTEINAKLDALKAALLQRMAELEASQPASKSAGTEAGKSGGAAASVPSGDPNQMYQAAYLDYTKGNFDLAVSGFREYLKSFPDAEFAGNAQYWIGESYYSLGKYDEALVEFEKVMKAYPGSSKIPGAMLKKGYCLEALKKTKEARGVYEDLKKKYPNSEAAKLADERLKKK